MRQHRCPACGAGFFPEESAPARCSTCGAITDPAIWRAYRIVSMRWRFLASLWDHLLFFTAWWMVVFCSRHVFALEWSLSARWVAVVQISAYFAYFAVATWGWGGSPAKRLLGFSVVRAEDAAPISLGAAVLREVLGRALCLFLAPIGYATVISKHSRLQTLADILARTVVVVKRRP